ncbi:MAG: pyruvate kinase [Candidatus Peregrinibacteria bacterium]
MHFAFLGLLTEHYMTGIIATVGPATESPKTIEAMVIAGATHFRLNFSHGDHSWHERTIHTLKTIAPHIPIILDTKGPEIRTGDIAKKMVLEADSWLTLTTKAENANPEEQIIFVSHAGLPQDVEIGDYIALDSGLIVIRVLETKETEIITRVIYPGVLESRRHLNLMGKNASLPTLTKGDKEDIAFGLAQGIDIIALSFARDAECITETQNLCTNAGRPAVKIWAKIENSTGYENREKIAIVADGIMVARGDLGVETPFEELPAKQAELVKVCEKHGIFSIVATEMMESMIEKPRPTRAEISDVALAGWQKASLTMLSAETGVGKYPIETIKMMRKILDAAERSGITIQRS